MDSGEEKPFDIQALISEVMSAEESDGAIVECRNVLLMVFEKYMNEANDPISVAMDKAVKALLKSDDPVYKKMPYMAGFTARNLLAQMNRERRKALKLNE